MRLKLMIKFSLCVDGMTTMNQKNLNYEIETQS